MVASKRKSTFAKGKALVHGFLVRLGIMCDHDWFVIRSGAHLELPKSQHEQGVLHVLKEDVVVCKRCGDVLRG